MEKLVLTIGGLFKSFSWGDLFFFGVTLFLIVFLIYIIYMVKLEDENFIEEKKKDSNVKNIENKSKPLSKIVDELELNYKPKPIDLTEYEKELENTAIISYKELLERANNNIYYDDEYESGFDDLIVQKVDSRESNTQEFVDLPKAVMMDYESEEEFLRALKVLQKNLVR